MENKKKNLVWWWGLILLSLVIIGGMLTMTKTTSLSGLRTWPHKACDYITDVPVEWVEANLFRLNQIDPRLIKYVRARYINPPPKTSSNLTLIRKNPYNSWVVNFFKNKRNGIFIEAGANDGLRGSNTLYLEQQLNWTGILIECNPGLIPALKNQRRRAWTAGVCLAPSSHPEILNFSEPIGWAPSGTLNGPWNLSYAKRWTKYEVETIPLYTILAAVKIFEVDFFSFDIEAMELKVLEHFPFHLIRFKVLITEVHFYKPEELRRLRELLERNGYIYKENFGGDQVYVHNSVNY